MTNEKTVDLVKRLWAKVDEIDNGGPHYSKSAIYRDAADALEAQQKKIMELEEAKNSAYSERNKVVAFLSWLFPSGLKETDIPGWDPEWHGCVYIDLPTGQVSWHFHDSEAPLFMHLEPGCYHGEFDGHTTSEKYDRLDKAGMTLSNLYEDYLSRAETIDKLQEGFKLLQLHQTKRRK